MGVKVITLYRLENWLTKPTKTVQTSLVRDLVIVTIIFVIDLSRQIDSKIQQTFQMSKLHCMREIRSFDEAKTSFEHIISN